MALLVPGHSFIGVGVIIDVEEVSRRLIVSAHINTCRTALEAKIVIEGTELIIISVGVNKVRVVTDVCANVARAGQLILGGTEDPEETAYFVVRRVCRRSTDRPPCPPKIGRSVDTGRMSR